MKNVLIACVMCVGFAAFAGDAKMAEPAKDAKAPAAPAAAPAKDAKAGDMKMDAKAGEMADPMAMWKPKKATKKDEKAVEAAMKADMDAMMKGDLEACAAMVDFPVLMVTDNAAGQASSTSLNKEQWIATMKPAMEGMAKMKDAKMTEKHKMHWITDSLVWVAREHTMTMGKTKMEYSSGGLWINKDGKWMSKAMVEGGWGDVMASKGAMTTPPATTETKAAMK